MQNRYLSKGLMKSTLVALSVAGVAVLAACNNSKGGSGLRVAGGEIDASGSDAKYPGTVYAELNGVDFNGNANIIRNVGTIVDIGVADKYALVLSLADSVNYSNGRSVLPIFKSATIRIFLSNGEDSITLPGLNFSNAGILKDSQGRSYLTLSVGIKADKVSSSKVPDDKIRSLAQKLFLESPLMVESKNYRVPESAYMMIAVPKDAHPSIAALKAPSVVTSEDRAAESQLDGLQIAGFGENTVGNEKKSDFALSEALPSVMKRNFADIDALNKDSAQQTPLKKLIVSSPEVSKQIWEVGGSGLCGSKDGVNYDTGASVYNKQGQFLGFAVRSSVKSSGYKGKLDCSKTSRSDMATVVISPSRDAIEMFKSRAGQ